MRRFGKFLSMLLVLALVFSFPVSQAKAAEKSEDVVILYTTDVHNAGTTALEAGAEVTELTYASVAALKKELKKTNKYVALVDSGDAIQGEQIGALSKGSYLIDIMNYVGYDYATFGNHEFDFAVPQLKKLVKQANFQYLSCNFNKIGSKAAFAGKTKAYEIKKYGKIKVAFLGITTPEAFSKSTPTYFQNAKGQYIYTFCEGNNGKELYKEVQKNINDIKKEGADYIVALAHLGNDPASAPWTSAEVIKNTTGIDVLLDGHSHELVGSPESYTLLDKKGNKVIVGQAGTKLSSIGQLTITKSGVIKNKLITVADYPVIDKKTNKYLAEINSIYAATLEELAGNAPFGLYINNPEDPTERLIRKTETNAGDFVADAYLYTSGADVAVVNGGGIRVDIPAGDITVGDLIKLHPFGNELVVKETTGQHILDLLEMSASKLDENGNNENGGFQHVAGMTYTVDATIPSTVVTNDKGEFVEITGKRRVSNVKILNKKTGKYEKLNAKKTYTIASHNYMLKDGGDGLNMFKADKVLQDTGMKDYQVVLNYLQNGCNGVVPEQYKNPLGQGRIVIKTK